MSPESLPEYRINRDLAEPIRWREVIANTPQYTSPLARWLDPWYG